jgi:hypothetical protein
LPVVVGKTPTSRLKLATIFWIDYSGKTPVPRLPLALPGHPRTARSRAIRAELKLKRSPTVTASRTPDAAACKRYAEAGEKMKSKWVRQPCSHT